MRLNKLGNNRQVNIMFSSNQKGIWCLKGSQEEKETKEPPGYNAFAKEFHFRKIEGEYEVSSIAVLL